MEVGRTKTCSKTLEPTWGERFRLAIPYDCVDEEALLVVEVWDEDVLGTRDDFLGQV